MAKQRIYLFGFLSRHGKRRPPRRRRRRHRNTVEIHSVTIPRSTRRQEWRERAAGGRGVPVIETRESSLLFIGVSKCSDKGRC